MFAFVLQTGIVAPELPVATLDGALLLLLGLAHTGTEPVIDTGAVGDDQ